MLRPVTVPIVLDDGIKRRVCLFYQEPRVLTDASEGNFRHHLLHTSIVCRTGQEGEHENKITPSVCFADTSLPEGGKGATVPLLLK